MEWSHKNRNKEIQQLVSIRYRKFHKMKRLELRPDQLAFPTRPPFSSHQHPMLLLLQLKSVKCFRFICPAFLLYIFSCSAYFCCLLLEKGHPKGSVNRADGFFFLSLASCLTSGLYGDDVMLRPIYVTYVMLCISLMLHLIRLFLCVVSF